MRDVATWAVPSAAAPPIAARSSIRRSTEYYRGEQGRKYKRRQYKRQLEKRRARTAAQPGDGRDESAAVVKPDPVSQAEVLPVDPQHSPGTPTDAPALAKLPAELIEHVRMVVSLIEGRPISLEEIGDLIAKVFRQRSIGRRGKFDHTIAWLKANPP